MDEAPKDFKVSQKVKDFCEKNNVAMYEKIYNFCFTFFLKNA